MAEINGISLKKLTFFKDHEGCEIAQGTVYYKGKALGEWSQDAWGGPDIYRFNKSILDAEVEKYKNSDKNMTTEEYRKYTNLDCLLSDLLKLIDDEKLYKKGLKKGYTTFVQCDQGYRTIGYHCNGTRAEIEASDYYKEFIKKNMTENSKILIYESLEDFKIIA